MSKDSGISSEADSLRDVSNRINDRPRLALRENDASNRKGPGITVDDGNFILTMHPFPVFVPSFFPASTTPGGPWPPSAGPPRGGEEGNDSWPSPSWIKGCLHP